LCVWLGGRGLGDSGTRVLFQGPDLPRPRVCHGPPCLLCWQKGIVLTDACPATTDPVVCSKVFYGVMNKGLFSAIQSFSNLVGPLGQAN
jgi:hypothetical protein